MSVVKVPQDIVYKGLPGAPQHVTLFGDSSQPGLYVDRIKFLPGMKVMPHWHPDTVRTVLVMSGTDHCDRSHQQRASCTKEAVRPVTRVKACLWAIRGWRGSRAH